VAPGQETDAATNAQAIMIAARSALAANPLAVF
jgi:hypothetical protein